MLNDKDFLWREFNPNRNGQEGWISKTIYNENDIQYKLLLTLRTVDYGRMYNICWKVEVETIDDISTSFIEKISDNFNYITYIEIIDQVCEYLHKEKEIKMIYRPNLFIGFVDVKINDPLTMILKLLKSIDTNLNIERIREEHPKWNILSTKTGKNLSDFNFFEHIKTFKNFNE